MLMKKAFRMTALFRKKEIILVNTGNGPKLGLLVDLISETPDGI